MKKFLSFLFYLIIFLNIDSFAAQNALLIGGSGEDFKENELKEGFQTFKTQLQKRNWHTRSLFNGKTHAMPGSQSASNENIEHELNQLISSSKKGDQVLLFFHGHGLKKEGTQKTHHFVTEDPDGYNMDLLQTKMKALEEKGAQVALIDLSCYSGNTQSLQNKSNCVVTLAAPNYISVCAQSERSLGFTNNFVNLPETSAPLNLESHFLAARKKDIQSANLPQISSIQTPLAQQWDHFLSISDPLNHQGLQKFQPRGSFMNIDANDLADLIRKNDLCELSSNKLISDLESLVSTMEEISAEILSSSTQELQIKLQEYVALKKEIKAVSKKLEIFFRTNLHWDLPEEIEAGNSLNLGFMKSILGILNSSISEDEIAWLNEEERSLFKRLKPYQAQLQKKYDETTQKAGDPWKQYEEIEKKLAEKNAEVIILERKIYDDFHKFSPKKEKNPCESFQL